MFDFNPKYLLVIPATVIFYKLCQKEEVNIYYPSVYDKYEYNDSLKYNKISFEKPRLPHRRLKTKQKLFEIMDNEIKKREVKTILYNIIDQIVENPKKEEKKEEKKDTSYLSYFNISKFMRSKNDDLEKVSISSDGSYDKVSENSKFSDFSKISEFSKISDFSKISEIDIKE